MFEVSFVELAVIALVALLVLGPEKLPRAARMAGYWMRKARASWYSIRVQIERELADEEMKRSLDRAGEDLKSIGREIESAVEREAAAIKSPQVDPSANASTSEKAQEP